MEDKNGFGLLEQETSKENANVQPYDLDELAFALEIPENEDAYNEEENDNETPENKVEEKPEKEKRQKRGKEENEGVPMKQALAATNITCTIIKHGCAVYSGEPSSEFDIPDKDRKEIQLAWADYIEVTGQAFSPLQGLVFSVGAVGMYYGVKAHRVKTQKDKVKKETARLIRSGQISNDGSIIQTGITAAPEKEYVGRKQFQVHKNGYYMKDVAGNSVNVSEATEKAEDWIIEIINTKKREQWSNSQINQHILDIIKNISHVNV